MPHQLFYPIMPLLLHLLYLSVSQHSTYQPEIPSLSTAHQPLGHHHHNRAPMHRVMLHSGWVSPPTLCVGMWGHPRGDTQISYLCSPSSGFSGAKSRSHRQMHQWSRWTATPSRVIVAPISAIPSIFMPHALPGTALQIYPGLGQAPICFLAYPVDCKFIACIIHISVPWLVGRKGIQSVKNWVVWFWHDYLSAARCRFAYGPADATATHCLLLQ